MPDEASSQMIALQELVMHMQRELEHMHDVLISQAAEIDELRRNLAKLRDDVAVGIQGDKFPTPAEDRPPHY